MAVKIKLKRMGKIRTPQYRIIVADSRTKRDGRAIEEIGKYHPKEDPSLIHVDSERAQYWLGVGAQPTEPVLKLFKITGDWQKFKGLPGAEGTLKVKETKANKSDLFNAALAEVHGESSTDATTPKKRTAKKATAKKAEAEVDAAPAKRAAKKSAKKAEAKAETKPEAGADKSAAAEATSEDAKSAGAASEDAKSAEAASEDAKSAEATESAEAAQSAEAPELSSES
ncbi:MAG TPA: 30S ribosomal protein S16 [Jiangellaceae bacterium]